MLVNMGFFLIETLVMRIGARLRIYWGFIETMEQDSYLGLSLLFGRSKVRDLMSIKERIWSRVKSWGGRLLTQAGRAVMIQSIGHAIPLYAMSYFKLLRGFLNEINMLLVWFWWGSVGSNKRIHWKQWE